jgi:hypothetical protein
MKDFVYLSEQGDDKCTGLTEKTAVRTAARAIKMANISGRDIKVLGDWKAAARLSEKLKRERATS